jgi:hypothetical protein
VPKPPVPNIRATITGGPEGLEIVIPARRHFFPLVFLGIWLVGWVMGETAAIRQLFSERSGDPAAFLLFWLILWTVGGGVAVYLWLWMLVGKERILMGASALRMKHDVLGLGRVRTYELLKIRNLRVAPPPAGPRGTGVMVGLPGVAGGLIAFEYAGKTVRFGASIDEIEARTIVERMRQRHSFGETSVVT